MLVQRVHQSVSKKDVIKVKCEHLNLTFTMNLHLFYFDCNDCFVILTSTNATLFGSQI